MCIHMNINTAEETHQTTGTVGMLPWQRDKIQDDKEAETHTKKDSDWPESGVFWVGGGVSAAPWWPRAALRYTGE